AQEESREGSTIAEEGPAAPDEEIDGGYAGQENHHARPAGEERGDAEEAATPGDEESASVARYQEEQPDAASSAGGGDSTPATHLRSQVKNHRSPVSDERNGPGPLLCIRGRWALPRLAGKGMGRAAGRVAGAGNPEEEPTPRRPSPGWRPARRGLRAPGGEA